MSIIIKKGDITQVSCDAVVNPANSFGYMGGGAAGAIKRIGGIEIEKEAVSKAPVEIGKAIATTAGSLPCTYVIHAPTMKQPAMRIDVKNVKKATMAALELAEKLHLRSIAIPGMGTGVGGISPRKAAQAMIDVVKKFDNKFEKIILIDRNDEMINSFNSFI